MKGGDVPITDRRASANDRPFPAGVRIGINPIVWSNDDFRELGGETPLERCLGEAHESGYAGIELGHKFPREAGVLAPLLERHHLRLVSGWHSLVLLDRSLAEERDRFLRHLELLDRMGSRVVIVAECSASTYSDRDAALRFDANGLDARGWDRLVGGLETLVDDASRRGLRVAYHPHMGTVIQGEREIRTLMERTSSVQLLFDTGHLAFAGADPLAVLEAYAGRVGHVHLKDVRAGVVARARSGGFSFARAVREGVFTVPGDGSIDYAPIFARLGAEAYDGWLVVEAEQDPAKADPLAYARMARAYITEQTGL